MGYGTLDHAFWENPDLQELGLECRTVAAYLLTCRHASSEGYYRLPVGYMSDDLGVDGLTILGYMQALDLKDFARYDRGSQVVFIRNAMRYRPPRGAKSVQGALAKALQVPPNPFRGLFYDAASTYAPDLAVALRDVGWHSDRPVEPTLFQHTPDPEPLPVRSILPPLALAPPAGDDEQVEAILQKAANLSVQQSLAQREPIRSATAVAKARLSQHRATWAPLVRGWLDYFEGVSPDDMAKALVDGGSARPHWRRSALA